jgi:cytosine/adenosine deaminase-related metal-dependent hydrolase
MSAREALELATLGGAAVLGRDDIGALAPGKAADLIGFDLSAPTYAGGAVHDPVAALVFCQPRNVDFAVVNGRILVEEGQPRHVEIGLIVETHNNAARALLARAGLA